MRLLRLLLFVPLVILLGFFIVSNTQTLEWSFWPLPYTLVGPAYLFPLFGLGIGLVAGAFIMWVKAGFSGSGK